MENNLQENIDFYFDTLGRMVFTETYHLKRGYCCHNDCKHCPYQKEKDNNEKINEHKPE
ncbi:MAG TPA: DUF5522 domain-containing protein [Chitinophagales bacterium]|nr:DUF5522 domain-containing protein [Chitinophagales bacterium]